MDPTALFTSSLSIQIHAYGALLATGLGTVVMIMEKGTPVHKAMGRVWVGLMVLVALSSFAITETRMFGPFSWIHGLSVLSLVTLVYAVSAIRRGDVAGHRSAMISLYVFALVLTGGFTLLPGRRMHAVLFADGGQSAALAAGAIAVLVGLGLWLRFARAR